MRLITHYVFSFSVLLPILPLAYVYNRQWVSSLLSSAASGSLPTLQVVSLTISLWLSLAVNFVVDRAGHTRLRFRGSKGIPVRAWRTHSIYTAPLWGILVGSLTALAYGAVQLDFDPQKLLVSHWLPSLAYTFALLGCYSAYTHLLLDSLTEAGIYTKRNRRVALAHFRYNNPALNFGVIILSIFFAYYFWIHLAL